MPYRRLTALNCHSPESIFSALTLWECETAHTTFGVSENKGIEFVVPALYSQIASLHQDGSPPCTVSAQHTAVGITEGTTINDEATELRDINTQRYV